MTHQDFAPTPDTLAFTQKAKNEIARRSAALCWRIVNEHPDPKTWRTELEAAPPELRECLRAFLLQKFNELKDRRRREESKRTPVGDAELAKIGEIARRL